MTLSTDPGLAATTEERMFAPQHASRRAARVRFGVVLLICFLLHAAPIAWLVHRGGVSEPLAPDEKEIPVEVVAEPPPPEPPPQPEQKKEEQKTLDENEAHDAPRKANEEKLKTDDRAAATKAPKVAPKPATPPPAEKAEPAKPAAAPTQETLDQRPDGDPVAPATPQQQPQETAKQTSAPKAQPAPPPKAEAEPDPVAAALAPAPDQEFAPASQRDTLIPGNSPSTYLSVVFGMVKSHLNIPETRAKHQGEINFMIDYSGKLIGQRLLKSSGSPEVDAAAMAAIRAAAPFPPSPIGIELSLDWRYGK